MIDQLFQIAVNNVCLSSALAVAALVSGWTLKRPAITHILWLLVIVKLLTPPVVSISAVAVPWITDTSISGESYVKVQRAVSEGSLTGTERTAFVPVDREIRPKDSAKPFLLFVWLFGSGIILTWSLLQAYRFHRLLRSESGEGPAEIQSAAARISSRLGLVAVPKVYSVTANISPMVWWIGSEVWTVFPASLLERMDARQCEWILAHELAHVRRRDYIVRWIEWLAFVCFWWNPVTWLARRQLRASEELCCDALVVSSLNVEPGQYGASLLNAIELLAAPGHRSPPMTTGVNGGNLLKKRIRSIVSPDFTRWTPRWLVACTLLCSLAILPLGLIHGQRQDTTVTQFDKGYPEQLPVPYIARGACPFEGCSYGVWEVLKEVPVYEKPSSGSVETGRLHPGEIIAATTGDVHVIPGRARATGTPHSSAEMLDPEKEIYILDYIGEGYSRVFQDGAFAEVKIARSKNQCDRDPNMRYCWAEVLEEPVVNWWVSVESAKGGFKGWVSMQGNPLQPIDALASGRDPVRAFINDADGYTNVRLGPSVRYEVVSRIHDGEEFFCYPRKDSDWWIVITKTKQTGYVHKSRIRKETA